MLLKIINLNDITAGQFIDLEHYIKKDDICSIASYLYVPRTDFYSVPYEYVLAAYNHYMDWRSNLLENYKPLFAKAEEKDDEAIYNKVKIKKRSEDDKFDIELKQYNEIYSWYGVLYSTFANEDYLKMKECYKLRIIEVLNHLTFLMKRKIYTT
jgi:hypothetical protein